MNRLLQSVLLFALLPSSVVAQQGPASSVAAAYGNGVSASEVELPQGASLQCGASQVLITAVRRVGAGLAQVTARCDKSSTLPVIAWVRTQQMPQASRSVVAPLAKTSEEPPLIKAGARATLQLAQKGMLITLQVVALASGRAGETIRVMDTTGRLRYRATVISADLLRAELP
jgi:hypothetical protein